MATLFSTRLPDLGRPPRLPPRRALVVALVISVLLHAAWTLWPVDEPVPETPPLQATLTEMPAPPQAVPQPSQPPTYAEAGERRMVETTGHPAVDAALRSLANASRLAPGEQIAAYEAAHQVLQETLSSIEG